MKPLTIAMDGPGSAGKGTVARGVARELGYQYIDTGAMYRSVALMAERRGVDWEDVDGLATLARGLEFRFAFEGDVLRVVVDGVDITRAIRTDDISMAASTVSKHAPVRSALLQLQRDLGAAGGVVMDGRDIGTVVLPEAELKVYLDASLEVRARRRHEELIRRGDDVAYQEVRDALDRRDHADMERETAPLRAADDAVTLDTTDLTIRKATLAVLDLARERGA